MAAAIARAACALRLCAKRERGQPRGRALCAGARGGYCPPVLMLVLASARSSVL